MKTAMRRTVLSVVAALIVVVVAALVFAATFDVNRYKPEIVTAVQQRTGRTLAFDGDLSLGVFPRLAIKLPATTLSAPGSAESFAKLRSAQASVSLLPLLRRQIEVDAVRIDGLQATVVRRKDGTTNIDDLLHRPQPPAAEGKTAPGAPPADTATAAAIGAIELRDADITWRDLAANRTLRVANFDLHAGRYAAGTRMPLDAHGTVTSSEPALNAKVGLKADVEWDAQGGLRALHALALTGEGAWALRPIALDARAEALVAASDALEVRGLAVTGSARDDGKAPLELRLTAPRIEASRARAIGERVELTLARRGDEPVDAKVVIAGLKGTASRLEATDVRASGSTRRAGRSTRFDFASPLNASIDERTLRIERAVGEVVIEDRALGPKPLRLPLTFNLAIDGARESVALQFDARGEGLSARGKVSATGFASPRLVFDIDADQLDADRYFLAAGAKEAPAGTAPNAAAGAPSGATKAAAPAPTATPKAAVSAPAVPAADTKVEMTALRGLNATGNLRVARLRAKGTDIADLRAAVKAADGHLEVAPFSLRVHGGAVNGRLALDAPSNRAALSGTLSGIQLRSLVSTIAGRAALEGAANGRFDLATAGASVDRMKAGLNGTVALDVRDGALVGIDLADLLGTASNFLQARGRQTGTLDENRRTPFSQLSASFQVKDGIATSDDLKAKSPQLDVTGRGRIDLVRSELDYTLQAQVVGGPATEKTPLRSLAGVSVPVKIAGPVEHPSYTVDWAPVAAELLLRRASGRPGAPAPEQLLEGLGNLLKRRK